jgi:hypothetical protein
VVSVVLLAVAAAEGRQRLAELHFADVQIDADDKYPPWFWPVAQILQAVSVRLEDCCSD